MVKSPIKIIDSGTAPTTANLGEGQIAFGTVDGATKLYGSDGTTVSELGGGGGSEVNNITPSKVDIVPTTYDDGKASLAIGEGVVATIGDLSSLPEEVRQAYEAVGKAGLGSVAIGGRFDDGTSDDSHTVAEGLGNTAIGIGAKAGVFVFDEGSQSLSESMTWNTAVGLRTEATGGESVAIGSNAKATGYESVAIGDAAEATEPREFSVGSGSIQRRITHVTDPTGDQDAATKKYVDDQYSTLEAQIDDKGTDITALQGQVSTLETTVAGKADTSALDNYATKTELNAKADQSAVDSLTTTVNGKASQTDLDSLEATVATKANTSDLANYATKTELSAKADQTTVDSLTATVNGKVSSVTAGEGISITGTATAPVVNGMIAVPDYKNAQTEVPASYGSPFAVPKAGVVYNAYAINSDGGSTAHLSIVPNGDTNNIDIASSTYLGDGKTNYLQGVYPVSTGDAVYAQAGGGTGYISFAPYKFVEIS